MQILGFKKDDKVSNPSKMRIDLRFYADLISVGVFTLKVGRQLQLKNVVGRVAETSFLVKNLLHSDHKNVARHYVVRYSFIFLFFFHRMVCRCLARY